MATARDQQYTRLHVSPLNPSNLGTILAPLVLSNVRNISLHSLQTFPERDYGFIEIPKMDADKLKKKLHGSILKGTKVRVEAARPAKDLVPTVDTTSERPRKERKIHSKKRQVGHETIPAVTIGDRQVKRGWTVPTAKLGKAVKERRKDKDSQGKGTRAKSKYTTGAECLFKTILPPNVAADPKSTAPVKVGKKDRRAGREAMIHEFTHSTKHATFLRDNAVKGKRKSAAEYVDGKGWVDEDGNVVEEVKPRKMLKVGENVVKTKEHKSPPPSSSSSSSSSSFSTLEDSDAESERTIPAGSKALAITDSPTQSSTSSSASLSSDLSDTSREDLSALKSTNTQKHAPSKAVAKLLIESKTPRHISSDVESPSQTLPGSSGPSSGLSIMIPDSKLLEYVHPLEALYKKPKTDALADIKSKDVSGSFSFFGADDHEDEAAGSMGQMPMTPFTQKEFNWRGERSAAPTPDTAFANDRFEWPKVNGDEGDEDPGMGTELRPSSTGEHKGEGALHTADSMKPPESEFVKWFYDHRGDITRAWKKRRRMAAKERRQRENRKR